MRHSHWSRRSWQGLLLALMVSSMVIATARSQQTKVTDNDVNLAIRICSLGTKKDAGVNAGLDFLKRRILTGHGGISESEIPSVLGSGVQSDESKVVLFNNIQKCVVERIDKLGSELSRTEQRREYQHQSIQQHGFDGEWLDKDRAVFRFTPDWTKPSGHLWVSAQPLNGNGAYAKGEGIMTRGGLQFTLQANDRWNFVLEFDSSGQHLTGTATNESRTLTLPVTLNKQ